MLQNCQIRVQHPQISRKKLFLSKKFISSKFENFDGYVPMRHFQKIVDFGHFEMPRSQPYKVIKSWNFTQPFYAPSLTAV